MWALFNCLVDAEPMVVKEMLGGVPGPAAWGTNGISFSLENV